MEEDIVSEGVINTAIIRLGMINRTWSERSKVKLEVQWWITQNVIIEVKIIKRSRK